MRLLKIFLGLFLVAGLSGGTFLTVQAYKLNAENKEISENIRAEKQKVQEALIEAANELSRINESAASLCDEVNYFNRDNITTVIQQFTDAGTQVRDAMRNRCQDEVKLLENYHKVSALLGTSPSDIECEQDAWGHSLQMSGFISNTSSYDVDVWFDITASSGGFSFASNTVRIFNLRSGSTEVWSGRVSTEGYVTEECGMGEFYWWPK